MTSAARLLLVSAFAILLAVGAAVPSCPVCGMNADPAISASFRGGQTVSFCSTGCKSHFLGSTSAYYDSAAVSPASVSTHVTCPVCSMDVTVGASTPHLSFKHGQQLFFCNGAHEKQVEAQPQSFMQPAAVLRAAALKMGDAPACPVCGMDADPSISTKLAGGQTVSFCSDGCHSQFEAAPATYYDAAGAVAAAAQGSHRSCPVCQMDVAVDASSAHLTLQHGQQLFACSAAHESRLQGAFRDFIQTGPAPTPTPAPAPAPGARCPVCNMEVKSEDFVTFTHGQQAFFCSKSHADQFAATPAAFVAGSGGEDNGGGMAMYFYSGPQATLLFKSWQTSEWGPYLGACIAVLAVCVLHEWLSTVRVTVGRAAAAAPRKDLDMSRGLLGKRLPAGAVWGFNWRALSDPAHIVKSLLYLVSATLAYLLMLIVMTYNAGLFIVVPIGLALGHYLFGAARAAPTADTAVADENSDVCCAS